MKIVTIALLALSLFGCSKGKVPNEKKRPLSFYSAMMNPGADFEKAAAKLSELKVLVSDQKYDMRYALFENGKFYYEVANLGTGTGDWKYREGYINLFSSRSFFDLDIDMMAVSAEGEALEMNFVDRFGNNAVTAKLREPSEKPMGKLSIPETPWF